MLDEETTPSQVETVTPAVAPEATPAESGSQTTQVTEPETPVGEESYTPEQISEWKHEAERNAATQAEITRQQQENARLRESENKLRDMIGTFVGREESRLQSDPVAMAEAELQTATESFDPAAIAAATRKLVAAESDARLPGLRQELHQQHVAQEQFARAKDYGDYTQNDLAATYGSLSVDELAMVQANRDGTLADKLSARRERDEQQARQAAALNTIYGSGTPGMSPGGLNGKPQKRASFLDLARMNDATRKRVLDNSEYDVILEDLPRGMTPEQAANDLLGR